MKISSKCLRVGLIFGMLFIAFAQACFAGSALVDPLIPDGERITYNVRTGNDSWIIKEETIQKTENNRKIYQITSTSEFEDLVIKIDCANMTQLSSDFMQKGPELVINTRTTVVKCTLKTGDNEILVIDFRGLSYLLRGFPYRDAKTMKIRTDSDSSFSINVNMIEETSLKIMNKNILCYKLGVSMSGILGTFLPKTYFWYSCEPPHYLVRYEGSSGAQGSPKVIREIISYAIK